MKEKCEHCEKMYKNVGMHWGHNPAHQPKLTKRQYEILLGFLMSDACVSKRERNSPRYILELSNKRCIYWVASELSNLYPNISNVEKETEYNGEYKGWRLTFSHKGLSEFTDWYCNSGKKYPNNIELSPVSFSTWYAGDGTLRTPENKSHNAQMAIKCIKEMENWEAVDNAIESLEINISPTYGKYGNVLLGHDDAMEALNYMEIVPGYEYKWSL